MENIVMVLFDVESEAYQALTELKRELVNPMYAISQIGLVRKQGERVVACDGADSGVDTGDDTARGGLVGSLVGMLGGPIGMLFCGGIGALVGSMIDSGDARKNMSMLECVGEKMREGQVGLIALIQENDEAYFDRLLSKFKTVILRWDAAVISEEVEEAQKLEKEMKKEARERLHRQKKEERRQELEEKRSKIHADFEAFKAKLKKE